MLLSRILPMLLFLHAPISPYLFRVALWGQLRFAFDLTKVSPEAPKKFDCRLAGLLSTSAGAHAGSKG